MQAQGSRSQCPAFAAALGAFGTFLAAVSELRALDHSFLAPFCPRTKHGTHTHTPTHVEAKTSSPPQSEKRYQPLWKPKGLKEQTERGISHAPELA